MKKANGVQVCWRIQSKKNHSTKSQRQKYPSFWRSFKTQRVQRLGHTEMGTHEYVFYISFHAPSKRLCLIFINLKLYCTYSYKTPSEHTSQSSFQYSSQLRYRKIGRNLMITNSYPDFPSGPNSCLRVISDDIQQESLSSHIKSTC